MKKTAKKTSPWAWVLGIVCVLVIAVITLQIIANCKDYNNLVDWIKTWDWFNSSKEVVSEVANETDASLFIKF